MKSKEILNVLTAATVFVLTTACLYGCKNKIQPQRETQAQNNVHPTTTVFYDEANREHKHAEFVNIGEEIPYYDIIDESPNPLAEELLVYNIKEVNIYDRIDDFKFWVGDPGGRYIRNGKLSRHYKYVVLDIDVQCGDVGRNDTMHSIDIFSLYSEDREQTPGIWYFEIDNSRYIGDYGYVLGHGESAHIKIGFLCPTKTLERKTAFIKADCKYNGMFLLRLNEN